MIIVDKIQRNSPQLIFSIYPLETPEIDNPQLWENIVEFFFPDDQKDKAAFATPAQKNDLIR